VIHKHISTVHPALVVACCTEISTR